MIRVASTKAELILKIENLLDKATEITQGVGASMFADHKEIAYRESEVYIALANSLLVLLREIE